MSTLDNLKGSLLTRVVQNLLLTASFIFSQFFIHRGSIIMISNMIPEEFMTEDFILLTIIITATLMTILFLVLLRIIYSLSAFIYKNMIYKRVINEIGINVTMDKLVAMPKFPISLRDFSFYLVWFVIGSNVITGLFRLLYISYPFMYGFIESFIPILVSISFMSLFFLFIKRNYVEEKILGSVFISLAIPYTVFVFLFM